MNPTPKARGVLRGLSIVGMLGMLIVLLAMAGCVGAAGTTVGSGQLKTETRSVSGFRAVTLAAAGDMTITQTGTESLSISAEDNLLPFITTDVSGDTLRIAVPPGTMLRSTRPIHYVLTVARLDTLTLSGAGNITGSGLTADALRVTLSGAGKLTLSGTVAQQEVLLSGAGLYDASSLQTSTAKVTVSGLGSARVNVRDALDATVSGAGSIVYFGNPTVTQHVTGAGSVSHG